jgi:Holliday junction resolvase
VASKKKSKAAGTRVEKKLRDKYIDEGWICHRSPASIGTYDLIALKAGYKPRLIEVKANVDGGPYKTFGPAKRKELQGAAEQAGADAILAYWPPHCNLKEIFSKDWP